MGLLRSTFWKVEAPKMSTQMKKKKKKAEQDRSGPCSMVTTHHRTKCQPDLLHFCLT